VAGRRAQLTSFDWAVGYQGAQGQHRQEGDQETAANNCHPDLESYLPHHEPEAQEDYHAEDRAADGHEHTEACAQPSLRLLIRLLQEKGPHRGIPGARAQHVHRRPPPQPCCPTQHFLGASSTGSNGSSGRGAYLASASAIRAMAGDSQAPGRRGQHASQPIGPIG
jgi:hypothetical protein